MSKQANGHWNRWLLRRIGWTLLAKLVALIALSYFFFGDDHRPSVDGEEMHRVLFVHAEQHTEEKDHD